MFVCCLYIRIRKNECDKGVLPVTINVLSNGLASEQNVWIVERNDLSNDELPERTQLAELRLCGVPGAVPPRQVRIGEVGLGPRRRTRGRRDGVGEGEGYARCVVLSAVALVLVRDEQARW